MLHNCHRARATVEYHTPDYTRVYLAGPLRQHGQQLRPNPVDYKVWGFQDGMRVSEVYT